MFWVLHNSFFYKNFLIIKCLFPNDIVTGFILLIISLFLGFVFHGIWRNLGKKFISKELELTEKEKEHNSYLSTIGKDRLIEYFSSKCATWGSIIIGLIFSVFVVPAYSVYYLLFIALFYQLYKVDREKANDTIKKTYKVVTEEKR